MNMKLSYRDKVIFIVVIVIIILVAGFFLFIQPKFKEIESAKFNLETKQQEKVDLETKIATLPDIIDNIKAVADEIGEKQEMFLAEQDPYLNEIYLREALANDRIDISAMDTTYASAADILRYTVEKKNLLAYDNKMSADLYNELPQEIYDLYNNVEPEAYPSTIIGVTVATITIHSDLELRDAYKLIDRIAADEKTITLNTIASGTDELEDDKDYREVTAVVTMYSIFPLNVEQVKQESTDIPPLETAVEAEETPAA